MGSKGRTSKSLINMSAALGGQMISLVIAFATRIIFARLLGEVYLGVNGLCTSIVGLLSLAEMGIGESINYKLYKPLADNNIEQVKSLMKLYKNLYRVIGIVIFVIGLMILPFLNTFFAMSEKQTVDDLQLIFLLFIVNSASSYWLSYRRALIISDQKRYIVTIIHYSFYCLMNILQILFLIKTRDFIVYLIIMIACTFLENVVIFLYAEKMYPYLKEVNVKRLSKDDTTEIKKNTLALMYHKIGSTVVNSTDNILASKFVGIAIVGFYSNYLLVTTALNTIIAQLFSAVTASVGNLGTSESSEKSEEVLNKMYFGNFCLVAVICASFYSSINILIKNIFGESFLLSNEILMCITINLYLYNIRRTVWTFRDAYGLFWYDRYKAVAEVIINLGVSILLGRFLGLEGILIGTIVSSLTTSIWIEPYILYKHAFKKKAVQYYIKITKNTLITLLATLISTFLVHLFPLNGIVGFCIGVVISSLITLVIITIIYGRSSDYTYYISLAKSFALKLTKRR